MAHVETGDGLKNQKNEDDNLGGILLMAEILHQLRLVVYPIIYRVLYIPGGCLGFLNHQQYPENLSQMAFFTNILQKVFLTVRNTKKSVFPP